MASANARVPSMDPPSAMITSVSKGPLFENDSRQSIVAAKVDCAFKVGMIMLSMARTISRPGGSGSGVYVLEMFRQPDYPI